jgi:putative inorganic carbon (hco3(-)) transporter
VAFFLFFLINATLFVRPAEIVPSLLSLPIYNVLMASCLVISAGRVIQQLGGGRLAERPISACVLGMLAAVGLSHASHLDLGLANEAIGDFGKVALYYLLLVAVVDTPARLRHLLYALAGLILVVTLIAVFQYHGIIHIEGFEAVEDVEFDPKTGEYYVVMRMCSTGIFNDPNDLCLLLVTGIAVGLYLLGDRRLGPLRMAWLGPIGLFGYALTLTHSRGGFLALLACLLILFWARFGWRKAIPLIVIFLPAMFLLFAGRQTNLSAGGDTGQQRIQLWTEGLVLMRGSPLFGIGWDRYAAELGLVAHNSFVHSFVELGFFGGTMFFGAFYLCLTGLGRAADGQDAAVDPELRRLRPYLMALVSGYAVGMLTVSRCYIVPTYMVLGICTAYFDAVATDAWRPIPRLDGALALRLAAASAIALGLIYVYTRFAVRWG